MEEETEERIQIQEGRKKEGGRETERERKEKKK